MINPRLSEEELKALLQGLPREVEVDPAGLKRSPSLFPGGSLSAHHPLGIGLFNLMRDFRTGKSSHSQWNKEIYRIILTSRKSGKSAENHPVCTFNEWLSQHGEVIEALFPSCVSDLLRLHEKVHEVIDKRDPSQCRGAAKWEVLDIFYDESVLFYDMLEDLERKISVYMANHDPVTQVYGQEMVIPLLEMEQNRIQRAGHTSSLAIMAIGSVLERQNRMEEERNILLNEMGQYLVHATRPYDFILRFDGEEFLCVFPETNVLTALPLVRRLCEGLENLDIDAVKESFRVHVTAGLSWLSPTDGVARNIKRADKALELAIRRGEGSLCVLGEDESPSYPV